MLLQARIQKWGNSLALRLSGPLKDIPHFKENMLVDIKIDKSGIRVKPALSQQNRRPYSEAELLRNITPHTAHADEL